MTSAGRGARPGDGADGQERSEGLGPVTWVSTDVVLLTIRAGQLSVLLVHRAWPPFEGRWALPGGPVRLDEDLDTASRRHLADRAGFQRFPGHLEQLRTWGAPGRDPRGRVVSVGYLGLVPDLPTPPVADNGRARLWPVVDLAAPDGPPLAFDHAELIAAGVERARAKLEYSPLATAFVEEPFTLAELRRVYEAVWGTPVRPASFRRRVLSVEGFVVPLGETAPGGAEGERPADLYRRGPAVLLHPAVLRPSGAGDAEPDGGEDV